MSGTDRILSPPRLPTHFCWTYRPTRPLVFSSSPRKSVYCLLKRSCLLCVPVIQHLEFGPELRRLAILTHPQTLRYQPKDQSPLQHQLLLHQSHHWYQLLDFLHLHQAYQRKTMTTTSPRYTHLLELKTQHMPRWPPTMLLRNQSQHCRRNQTYHLGPPLWSMTPKWLPPSMRVPWIPRLPSHSVNSCRCHRRSGIKYTKPQATDKLSERRHR